MKRKLQSLQRQDLEPEDDESEDDFLDRCIDEIGDEDVCQLIWDNRSAGAGEVKHRAAVASDGMSYTLSDETPDRLDDIIKADGWDLAHFKRNPIALFNHRSDFPIGKWRNLRIEGNALRGDLELARAGTSERIDEIRKLVEADILRAVSVGFRPKDAEPRGGDSFGYVYTKCELLETSLVSVPANPNALAVAKFLKISSATVDMVFAGQGNRKTRVHVRRRATGGQANDNVSFRKGATMSFAQRITAAEQRLVALRDQLAAHFEGVDDTNVSDEQLTVAGDLNQRIAQEERGLAVLRDAEKHLGATSDPGPGRALVLSPQRPAAQGITLAHGTRVPTSGTVNATRPFALAPKKAVDPLDLLVRSAVIQLLAHRDRKSAVQVLHEVYADDEPTRAVFEWQMRAATAPAMTTVAGWAAELVQQVVTDFMAALYPAAVYPRLSGYGLSLTFGRAGRIIIPTRATTPTIAGSFVGEGQPIPVRQGLFTSQTLVPKKMAVISTWTREMDEHSIPAIEGLLRDAIQMDTAIALDSVLLDTNPATVIRPAGILNGVASLTPTAGGGFTALVGDVKQVTGALLTGTKGNVRSPAWLMNPQQVNSAGLVAAPGAGVFPFRDEISQGRLAGWPIIESGTVPLATVIAIDAADFVSVGGDTPRFEISDQATLHLEDTAPQDIVGGPSATPVPAWPAKSMWQTDSLALRLILPCNWTIRRAGVVAWVQGVTW